MRLLAVGMGRIGRYWVERVLPLVPEVELAGVADVDPAALAIIRERLGLPAERCHTSPEGALEATRPDAVLVATTLDGHAAVARAALGAGCHVLTEKPFAPGLTEARALVDLARARGLTLMVSQNYRFYPAARAVADVLQQGRLGRLHEVDVDFRHRSTVAEPDGRRGHRLLAQPLLMDMSVHHFDLLRLLIGREPERVTCHSWNTEWSGFDGPPAAVATIVFDGGVVAGYRGSWLGRGRDTAWAGEWRLTFERGEVWWTGRVGMMSAAGDRVLVREADGEERELALPALPLVDWAGSLAEFAAAVREGREPETSGRENLGTLALTLAAVESAARDAPVDCRPPTPD
jgi:predicted dehydrogenase